MYRFKDADILLDKFQNASENNKMDAAEREIAVNAQQMIIFIRLRNHAGHPSLAKRKSNAHLKTIENTFTKTYCKSNKNNRRKQKHKVCDYKKWNTFTHYWVTKENKRLRNLTQDDVQNQIDTDNTPNMQHSSDISPTNNTVTPPNGNVLL